MFIAQISLELGGYYNTGVHLRNVFRTKKYVHFYIHHLNNLRKQNILRRQLPDTGIMQIVLAIICTVCQLQQNEICTSMFIALNIFKFKVKTY